MKKRYLLVVLMGLVAGLFFGCGDDDEKENCDYLFPGAVVSQKWVNDQNDSVFILYNDELDISERGTILFKGYDPSCEMIGEYTIVKDSISFWEGKSSNTNDKKFYYYQRKSDDEIWLYGFYGKDLAIYKRIK